MIKVFFSKKSDKNSYLKINNDYYSKKSFYLFLKKKCYSDQVVSYNITSKDNVKIIKIDLEINLYKKSYVLYMLESDYYYKKILKILHDKFYRKMYFLLTLILTISLINTEFDLVENYLEEKTHVVDELFPLYDDASCDFIDDDFSYLQDVVNFDIDKTLDDVFYDISKDDRCSYDGDLYLEEIDNIDKEKLIKKLLTSHSNSIKVDEFDITIYKEFDDDSIKELVDYIYDYIEKMKEIDPNFSAKNFACSLEDLQFYETLDYPEITYARYIHKKNHIYIVYNEAVEDISLSEWERVTNHELTHLENDYCSCNDNYYTFPTGVGIKSLFNEDASYQPYNYLFLSEAYAEKVASLMDGKNVSTYLPENQVINNLEFALAINPNYKMNTILKNSIERDPIGFYQNFPYLYDTREEIIDYIRMLKCYDYSLEYEKEKYIDLQNEDLSVRFDFKNYAFLKHVELFYKNLYILNEESDNDISLYTEDLINLFTCLMVKENRDSYDSVDSDLVNSILIEKYNDFKNNYLVYKYPNYPFMDIYDPETMEVGPIHYPSDIESDKRAFFDLLIDNYAVTFGIRKSNVLY